MQLISIATIGTVNGGIEMRDALILEESSRIVVVKVEANADFLTCVYCELGIDVVFAILPVATVVIRKIGDGGEGVGEMPLVRCAMHLIVGLCENELVVFGAVNEDARESGRVVRTGGIVCTKHAHTHC